MDKLTEAEIELISNMDYQVMNNGMSGWLSNRAYKELFEYTEVLRKRNSSLDQKVIELFQKATIAALIFHQNKDAKFFPEIKEICDVAEEEIEKYSKEYQLLAEEFMNSYCLEDYGTSFYKRAMGETDE